jgi:FkbM family methyltransferase
MGSTDTNTLIPFRRRSDAKVPHLGPGEIHALADLVPQDAVVFDIGAFHGDWVVAAAACSPRSVFHLFEPDPIGHATLLERIGDNRAIRAFPNAIACHSTDGSVGLWRYPSAPSWNTVHRRLSIEESYGIAAPTSTQVACTTLDTYCRDHGIGRIHYAKIHAEGSELAVLQGAKRLLSECRVDRIQFSYGGTYLDANRKLSDAFELLCDCGFDMYRIEDDGIRHVPRFEAWMEDYQKRDYIAIHGRLRRLVQETPNKVLDISGILETRGILPTGTRNIGPAGDDDGPRERPANLVRLHRPDRNLTSLQQVLSASSKIEAIHTDIDFETLEDGSTMFHRIHDLLQPEGFVLAGVDTPDGTRGEAIFTRRRCVTMSNFGRNGRFANQLFQYAFLSCYAKRHDLDIEIPRWPEGETFFGIRTTGTPRPRPLATESRDRTPDKIRLFDFEDPCLAGKDLDGYFQFHTSCYKPFRNEIRSMFALTEPYASAMRTAKNKLVPPGSTLVALHLRRGDFGQAYFFRSPEEWYLDWLETHWNQLRDPILYVASDQPDLVLPKFARYSPLHRGSLEGILDPRFPSHLADFSMLRSADAMAISNSSFGFMASMLNRKCRTFLRPHLPTRQLVSYDPWNAPPLFFHRIENHPMRSVGESSFPDSVSEFDRVMNSVGAGFDSTFEGTA